MKSQRIIPFSPPDISDAEIEEVVAALKSGWITTGPRTKELERKLAEFCHTSRVVCLNSATAAEELNFRICGIGEGDEVIVPAYTYSFRSDSLWSKGYFRRQPEGFYGDGLRKGGRGHYIQNKSDCCS